jgi:hypothetical protein
LDVKFEYIGHPISDAGFKKVVSRCMKGERSLLHKFYMSQPGRECPLKELPDVWERLKKYCNSPDFGKVKKAGTVGGQTASTLVDVPVNTTPYSTPPSFLNISNFSIAIILDGI